MAFSEIQKQALALLQNFSVCHYPSDKYPQYRNLLASNGNGYTRMETLSRELSSTPSTFPSDMPRQHRQPKVPWVPSHGEIRYEAVVSAGSPLDLYVMVNLLRMTLTSLSNHHHSSKADLIPTVRDGYPPLTEPFRFTKTELNGHCLTHTKSKQFHIT